MDTARRSSGLDDFGPDDFQAPLRLLVDCYNSEARLNCVGWLCARAHLLQLLDARLRIERDRRHYPEIPRQNVKAPVFIIGLPRTGSTLLFELMSRNPAFRVPLSWEVMLPSPPPRVESFDQDARIKRAARLLSFLNRIAPDFQRIHEVGAQLPQECLPMTAQAFRSLQFHTTHYVPTYQAWLNTADWTPAYAYHRRLLQHFQAFGPRGTWLLKAPAHLFGIEALFRVYPDARIIQTHRDPVKVAGSISSHCATLRQAFSDHLDLPNIGSTWCSLWAAGLNRTLKFRSDHPELAERFVDVYYEELEGDPLAVLGELHSRLQLPWSSRAARAYLDSHRPARHGRHEYQVEVFDLSPTHVRRCFGDYNGRGPEPAVTEGLPGPRAVPTRSVA
jgi:hypothetical protein